METPRKIPAIVYIDARNLFLGLLRHHKLNWFDIESFVLGEFGGSYDVLAIKYFTSPGEDDLMEPLREYHDALRAAHPTSSLLRIFFGRVQPEKKHFCATCPHSCVDAPILCADCPLHKTEETVGKGPSHKNSYKEKQTDVYLATEMIMDTLLKRRCRQVILISNDQDFVPVIHKIRRTRKNVNIAVHVPVVPRKQNLPKNKRDNWVCHELRKAVNYYKPISSANLHQYCLPDPIAGINKPARFK